MPSMIAVGISAAFDLPARAHVVDQGAEGIEGELRGIAVRLCLRVDPLRRVADGGVREAHASVEPRPAAQSPDHRNGNRTRDGWARDGTRVPEVQNRSAGILQSLGLLHELLDRKLLAMELGEDRHARANDGLHHAGITQHLHHVGAALLGEAHGRTHRGLDARLHRTIGHVAAHQSALRAAAHGLAADQHLVHRDFSVRRVSPEIHADGIAHRYEIHPGAVGDLRDLVVPGDHSDDFSPVALHFLERGNRYLGLHLFYLADEAPASRRIALIIAPASARFFPAISSALPWATEEKSTGVPMVSAAVPAKACVFAMMCPWSWTMTTKAS